MTLIKKQQKIKIIPEEINKFATGIIISSNPDSFVARVNDPSLVKMGQETEILISSEDFMVLFNSKVNKINNDNVFFSIISKISFVQKREYPRIAVSIPVLLLSDGKREENGEIINIGGGGMQILVSLEFPKNSMVKAGFKLYDKNEMDIMFKVLRVDSTDKGFVISGKFDEISNFDKTSIIQYCFKRQLETKCKN